jgi:hypothetical protein
MATYTAVLAGGNWNVQATWGGVGPPVAGDTAILNATSGQVTVTANAACLVLDCTGYLNTLTINTGFTLNVFGTGATIRLGGTISTLQQGVISTRNLLTTSAAIQIFFNGVTVPRLFIGYIAGAGTQTVTINGTNPTVQNLTVNNGTGGNVSLASTTLNVSNSLVTSGTGTLGGIPFNFSGTACSVTTVGCTIGGGFTVLNLCNLSLLSNLGIGGSGTYTFQPSALLTHNNFALSIATTVPCFLNTSPVVWYDVLDTSCRTNLTSDLNISRDLILSNLGAIFRGSGGTRNVNIGRNLSINNGTSGGPIDSSNTIYNLNGSFSGGGIWDGVTGQGGGFNSATFNINSSGYTIGSNPRNGVYFYLCNINLVGLNTCTVNTGHTVGIGATGGINTTTFNTNNTGTGGSQIIWENLQFNSNTIIALTNETTFAKNVTTLGTGTAAIGGAKLLVGGNLTGSVNQIIQGTSTIEFTGSLTATWATGSYQNTIIVSKSSGAVVTAGTAISWGAANRTFTINTNVNFLTNATTFTLVSTPLTINNTFGSPFRNLTIPSGTTLTLGGSTTTPITGTLALLGSAAFAGTVGWTCGTLTCSTPSSTITLREAITYTTTTNVIMLGTNAGRILMRSSDTVLPYVLAKWTLTNTPATQSMVYVNATAIDSSEGMTIYSFQGTTNGIDASTLNWFNGASQGTKAFTFVS